MKINGVETDDSSEHDIIVGPCSETVERAEMREEDYPEQHCYYRSNR
jgi:hypothetical protein